MENLYGLTRSELARTAGSATRASALFRALYRRHVEQWDQIPDITARVRALLRNCAELALPSVARFFESTDGTRRYLLTLADGEQVESVYIPSPARSTLCISSQIGCGLGCVFCLTARLGWIRDLSDAEIVGQVVTLMRTNAVSDKAQRLSIVFMGMGEPLQNYNNVMRAIEILQDDAGLAIPLSRITLSTAGLIPGIECLAREKRFPNLSISLTGTHNAIRDVLMPVNRKYPVEQLFDTVGRLPRARQRRVMFECVLIKGLTDSLADARHLCERVGGMPVKVNLIPFNPSPGISFEPPSMDSILAYQRVLLDSGIATFIRRNRGNDVSGACGQLRLTGAASSAVT